MLNRDLLRIGIFTMICGVFGWSASPAFSQKKKQPGELKAPEPGYVFPAGVKAGAVTDVKLGGYDWTPDVRVFALDPRVKIELTGTQGPVLVPQPPYWFGAKSTLTAMLLPREQPARITVPAGMPAGPVRWVAASASGASTKTGIFWVDQNPVITEVRTNKLPLKLPQLPITVDGRLSRIEEVDRYQFVAGKDGPVTCELFARRLGVNMNAALAVRDGKGNLIADAVDTDGMDLGVTFSATAGTEYVVSVHDLDFRGDQAFVYRLALTPGPRVVASIPAMAKRGETRAMEFVGWGVSTGNAKLESVTRNITIPADPKISSLAYRLETPFGNAPVLEIPISDLAEGVAPNAAEQRLPNPSAITGVFDQAATEARFRCEGRKGDVWNFRAESRRFGSPLDLTLVVLGSDGKELARAEDLPGTTDAGLAFVLPADGLYSLVVSDSSGKAGDRSATYRLAVEKVAKDFTLTTVPRLNIPVGETVDLVVKATRTGGFKEPIKLVLTGLPEGVKTPTNLVIPPEASELKISLVAAENAPAIASLLTITGTAGGLTRPVLVPIPGNLAVRDPDEEKTPMILVSTTLTPCLKLVAVEADGGRKVHRGSTHPAEVTLERINDFKGEVSLQMSAAQSYQRQGITGPEMTVPADANRAFYPCFMPEWLETTRTSRMELIGVVKVKDARGELRYLATPMNGRITMSIEGSILKVDASVKEAKLAAGGTLEVPISVLRSPKVTGAVTLEIRPSEEAPGVFAAQTVTVPPGQNTGTIRITRTKDSQLTDAQVIVIRGTAMQEGKYAVVSETKLTIEPVGK